MLTISDGATFRRAEPREGPGAVNRPLTGLGSPGIELRWRAFGVPGNIRTERLHYVGTEAIMHLAAHHAPASSTPAIAWEECACLLCGSAAWTPFCEASDPRGAGQRFLLVICTRCGLCYTNPRPDAVSIQQFYPADYRCHHAKDDRIRSADPISKLLPIHSEARLLDFGCGAGDFLRRMHALGWNVTGLDRSHAAIERIHDLPAHVGTLPHPFWTEACFEAVTMWQSLEHVHQPLQTLRAAHRLLTPGGRLLVTVPNHESFASRWFGSRWYGLDVPRHLTHFTPHTLRRMLNRAGFDDVEIRQQRRNSWIRHSAELAGGGILQTRLGSGLAGWWGHLRGRAECILAIATK
jgi:SAM-dependent methyltransferase